MDKILLVEDEITEIRILEFTLSKNGHLVTCSDNGNSALDILKYEKDFDLIISDINMEKINGIELRKTINTDSNLKKIPFIFLTSLINDETKKECENLGCDLYLFKSFVKFDIAKKAKEVLDRYKLELNLDRK